MPDFDGALDLGGLDLEISEELREPVALGEEARSVERLWTLPWRRPVNFFRR